MNKEKFQKKCQELIEYENQILLQVEKFIESKETILNEIGLKCCAFLTWNYYGEEEILFERLEMKENYSSAINITICRNEENYLDFDLNSINFLGYVTMLNKGIFINIFKFNKLPIDGLFEKIEESYQSIIKNGYEKTLSTLLK